MPRVKARRKWISSEARALAEAAALADPEAAMRKLVADLLEEAEQKEAPIDLPLVASFRGIIQMRTEPFNGTALLLAGPQGFEILVNASDPPGRRNFSAAHEICHTFFPDDGTHPSARDRSIGYFSIALEEEYLCDIGASALLLPPALVSARIDSYGCSLDAIMSMADEFQASIEATAVAWAQASHWPCAVVFFEQKLKPSQMKMVGQAAFPGMSDMLPQPELRISHTCSSSGFPFFLPRDKSVRRDGPIFRCMIDERTNGLDILELRGEERKIHTESVFVPYRKDGKITNRVVSLIRLVGD